LCRNIPNAPLGRWAVVPEGIDAAPVVEFLETYPASKFVPVIFFVVPPSLTTNSSAPSDDVNAGNSLILTSAINYPLISMSVIVDAAGKDVFPPTIAL